MKIIFIKKKNNKIIFNTSLKTNNLIFFCEERGKILNKIIIIIITAHKRIKEIYINSKLLFKFP